MKMMKYGLQLLTSYKLGGFFLVLIILQGCQAGWYPESNFGSTVNKAIYDQTANKNSPESVDRDSMGMDGPTAKSSIDNYQRSFEQVGGSSVYGGNSGAFVNPMGSSNSSLPSITGR
ncbi:hypothetical protein [Polynucleobacter kasalickyi]|uniref:Lipoprotein n=1 Tax=Polynucleobacter kasalickyi TaxID=1938817 RepID=A0A1W1Y3Z2_9BURK|nr:hypothetical protein [Polynucleobacter kasalickyi]SMC30883.1 hypothetical protein SAMN06296008_101301 [Polynucleobacter kasalickyi]